MNEKNEIIIVINENSQLYNQFNNSQLSDELREYIYSQVKGIPIKSEIFISIYHNYDMSDYEKKKLVKEIRESFGLDIRENYITNKFESYKRTVLLIVGMILLAVSHLLTVDYLYLLNQFFGISGWIMIWEYIYSLVFFSFKTKYDTKRYEKLIKSKIYFKKYE